MSAVVLIRKILNQLLLSKMNAAVKDHLLFLVHKSSIYQDAYAQKLSPGITGHLSSYSKRNCTCFHKG